MTTLEGGDGTGGREGGRKARQGLARRQLLSELRAKAAPERSEAMVLSLSPLRQANEINSNAAAGRQGA